MKSQEQNWQGLLTLDSCCDNQQTQNNQQNHNDSAESNDNIVEVHNASVESSDNVATCIEPEDRPHYG